VLAEPLGELSILKDLGFLIKNGPKVGQYASKALELDPKTSKPGFSKRVLWLILRLFGAEIIKKPWKPMPAFY